MIKCTSTSSLSSSLFPALPGVFCGQVVYNQKAGQSQAGRQSVSIKLINNFMLLKQTAEPKREHNKFFCV